jgi:hypothetical protein
MWAEVPILRQDVLAVIVCKEVCTVALEGKDFLSRKIRQDACHRARVLAIRMV